MNENDFIEALKDFCHRNGLKFEHSFHVGKAIAIAVSGADCVELLSPWLKTWTMSHTTLTLCEDVFISYITL